MKTIIPIIVVLITIAAGVFFFSRQKMEDRVKPLSSPVSTSSPAYETVDITASFTIVTDKITRSFANPKYHNKSPDVYITANNPSTIHIKKAGITWSNFFETLPMRLTKDCLITGDGETLCDGQNGTLQFYLNETEDKNLLDKEIKQNDKLLVKFTSR